LFRSGGSGIDTASGLARDLDGNIYLVGSTSSSNFPTASPFQSSSGGGTDAFLSKLAVVPAPVFTSITTDSGASASDQITNDQTLLLAGTSVASASITLYRAGAGQIGTTTANGSGAWSFDYTSTTLSEGTYAFTATAASGGNTSLATAPFLVGVA